MDKISIIMPVYNAEEYLKKSIEGILDQTYSNWELIIVDDCSRDYSARIIAEYAEKDKRIKLFTNQVNQGPGFTRNFGISKSTGEWLYFIDSDDTIRKDTLSKAIKKVNENGADICVWGYTQYYESDERNKGKKVECNVPIIRLDNIGDIAIKLDEAKLFAYVWNKLYRSRIIKKYNIRFPEQKYGEDFLFNIDVFNYTKKICYINECLYLYRKPEGVTLSTTFYDDYHLISVDRYKKEKRLLKKKNALSEENSYILSQIFIKHMFSSIVRVVDNSGISDRRKKDLVNKILIDKRVRSCLMECRCKKPIYKGLHFLLQSRSTSLIILAAHLFLIKAA
jgi:glycosyltransferase involved in cell wall biosynthesis